MRISSLILLLGIVTPGIAQNYDVRLIPDSLRQGANAVKRFEELKVVVKSPGRAVVKHVYVITVLNQKAAHYSSFSKIYDKFREINSIDGTLYGADGKELKNVKKKDIKDYSATDESLVDDNRAKVHDFGYDMYPHTIRYETEVELNGLFALPTWFPVPDHNYSVEHSKFIVEAPADYALRYKGSNLQTPELVTKNEKNVTYQWEIRNRPATKEEPFEPRWSRITPSVSVAPSRFEFGGYKGDMTTWKDFGNYIYQLYIGKGELPATIKQEIHALTDHISDQDEKIKVLYNYLQSNTRYISIQLGIGGLQPFDASYVASKKYGDCKALSNYMVSLLKEAGVTAFPVIIYGGQDNPPVDEDLPSNQFNHVVMCVPGKDTTWLECTDQTVSCGYMGAFTGNRKALLVTPDGGYLVNTPRYGVQENQLLRKVEATIDEKGNLSADVFTRFTGIQQDRLHDILHRMSAKEKEEYLNSRINLPTYKVEQFDYHQQKGKLPFIDEKLKITAPSYASVSGKRVFIQPNIFNRTGAKLETDKPRKTDIEIGVAYRDIDTLFIKVPEGFVAESLPKDVVLDAAWGKYGIHYKVSGNRIEVLRTVEMYEGIFPAQQYVAFAKFMEDMHKADRSKIVLVKKE